MSIKPEITPTKFTIKPSLMFAMARESDPNCYSFLAGPFPSQEEIEVYSGLDTNDYLVRIDPTADPNDSITKIAQWDTHGHKWDFDAGNLGESI